MGNTIFHISEDKPPQEGETESERVAWQERNAGCDNHHEAERDQQGGSNNGGGRQARSQRIFCDLGPDFNEVGGPGIHHTPNANIAATQLILRGLPQMPAVQEALHCLEATEDQVHDL